MAEVASGLNLFLKLRNPSDMPQLLAKLQLLQPRIRQALQKLHYVHFARFVPTPDQTTLMVITEFDGELRNYVMDFAAVVGDEFTQMLSFVQDAPPLPVQAHPREFWDFIERNSRPRVSLWSAYPDKTVLDILGPRRTEPQAYEDAPPAAIDLKDVQGNILRGYPATCAHHFLLAVTDAAAAGAFIERLVDGGEARSEGRNDGRGAAAADGHPRRTVLPGRPALRITTAEEWAEVPGRPRRRPDYFLNLGFTHLGLQALGVGAATLRRFPESFRMGPAAADRAPQNGDVDGSDPRHWVFGGPNKPQVHAMLSLYACDDDQLQARAATLRMALEDSGLDVVYERAARALPGGQVHFGYQDGIAQPHVAGRGAPPKRPDLQPAAAAGDFLLGCGYVNTAGGNFIDGLPPLLCNNGSYAAVRMMRQDVAAFHELLDRTAREHELPRDLVAAKLMGRWPSGAPLSLWPDKDGGARPHGDINRFDYAPTRNHPDTPDDADGLRCPVGSHVRRMNPRGALVAGMPYGRRIIRRGMPYGPVYHHREAPDEQRQKERGLFGLFICGDLEHQFEFLLRVWANGDIAATGLQGTQDPVIGTQRLGGRFTFPLPDRPQPVEMTVPRLVHTAGSVYLFMPGIGGLRHLAQLATGAAAPAEPPPVPAPVIHLDQFDPHDATFLADPYPAYARFRAERPVHFVGGPHQSHWVFSYALVRQVLAEKHRFLKNRHEPPLDGSIGDVAYNLPNGLFFMDPQRHEVVRPRLDPLFRSAIEGIGPKVKERARELIAQLRRKPAADLIQDYARPLALRAFTAIFGIPLVHEPVVANWVNLALAANNKAADPATRGQGFTARMALGAYFQAMRRAKTCPMGQPDLFNQMRARADAERTGNKDDLCPAEFQQTAVHFALGGYLSTEFLIATGTLNLLSHPAQLERLRTTPSLLPGAVQEMLRYDAPFQLTDRWVAQDTQLDTPRGPVDLRKGSKVTMVFGSANRDDAVFGPQAQRFDIARVPDADTPHFSLGGGIHHCIGAPLVDIVAPIALWELIDGLPGLAPADGRQWQKDPYFRSLSQFPLRW
jgi:cytochrome P450/deferrochelatase/peroxidase EfeB